MTHPTEPEPTDGPTETKSTDGPTGTESTNDRTETDPTDDRTKTEPTYELTVRRAFIAQHFLTVPDPGPEGEVHSHEFLVEVQFAGPSLDEYGYLVDIDDVKEVLDDLEARYRDTLLNDLPEFEDRNPSVEHFARLFGDRVEAKLTDPNPDRLVVRIWEDESAWASHRRRLGR